MMGAASRATQVIGEKAEQFLNAEAQLVESSRAYVRDNPITSLAIALGGRLCVEPSVESTLNDLV
jgi:ElaB/YqjD/DUF883 family membrane-anchored ribosome-binding protein